MALYPMRRHLFVWEGLPLPCISVLNGKHSKFISSYKHQTPVISHRGLTLVWLVII